MLKLLIFISVVMVISHAQMYVPPPVLAESFQTKFTIQRQGQEQFITGSGQWAKNMDKGFFLNGISLYYRTHSVNRLEIQVFKQHEEYHAFYAPNGTVANCTKTEIPVGQEIPSTWDWLKESHYTVYTKGNSSYPSWKHYTSFGSLQLAVKDIAVDAKPHLLIKVDNAGDVERMEFIDYEEVTPPDPVFGIPLKCIV